MIWSDNSLTSPPSPLPPTAYTALPTVASFLFLENTSCPSSLEFCAGVRVGMDGMLLPLPHLLQLRLNVTFSMRLTWITLLLLQPAPSPLHS